MYFQKEKRIIPRLSLLAWFAFLTVTSRAQLVYIGFYWEDHPDQKRIELHYLNRLVTAYCYADSVFKPFLFPVNTMHGITVTRGYPIAPLPGEPTDHPHHTGSWFNYESVNGLDFWNHSTAIPKEQLNNYGTIRHTAVVKKSAGHAKALLVTKADWLRPDGHCLLKETITYQFRIWEGQLLIDRSSELVAQDLAVQFDDAKDGLYAIRVSQELEQPARKDSIFTDAHGNKTHVSVAKGNATGKYYSSEELEGDSVWGTRARWVALRGIKDGKAITLALFDHQGNPGFPAYWHARGYGLFAVNPLGQKIFSNGKEALNFSLQPKEKVVFRYRMLVADEDVPKTRLESLYRSWQHL